MRAAIIGSIGARSLDVLIEKLAHRRRALQADDHTALRFVVINTLNEAAAVMSRHSAAQILPMCSKVGLLSWDLWRDSQHFSRGAGYYGVRSFNEEPRMRRLPDNHSPEDHRVHRKWVSGVFAFYGALMIILTVIVFGNRCRCPNGNGSAG